jgi:hypothetical protein
MKLIESLKVEKVEMYNLELSTDWRDDAKNRFQPPGENLSNQHYPGLYDWRDDAKNRFQPPGENLSNQHYPGLYKQVGTPVGRLVDRLAYRDDFSERVFHHPIMMQKKKSQSISKEQEIGKYIFLNWLRSY